MPETTTTTEAPAAAPESQPTPTGAPSPQMDAAAEIAKIQAEARKWEDRAKANANAAKELEALRASTMSETEKAIAEAEARGRSAATAELAGELVDAALRVEAATRLTAEQLEVLTSGIDRSKFLDADGKVDAASVKTFVDGIAPAQPTEQAAATPPGFPPAPDLGQGARGAAPALNSDALTASLKRAVGIT